MSFWDKTFKLILGEGDKKKPAAASPKPPAAKVNPLHAELDRLGKLNFSLKMLHMSRADYDKATAWLREQAKSGAKAEAKPNTDVLKDVGTSAIVKELRNIAQSKEVEQPSATQRMAILVAELDARAKKLKTNNK